MYQIGVLSIYYVKQNLMIESKGMSGDVNVPKIKVPDNDSCI